MYKRQQETYCMDFLYVGDDKALHDDWGDYVAWRIY